VTECSHCRKRYENSVRFCPVDGYAVVPVAEPMLGRVLMGQFQIQSVCGHGATGTVYRATQVGIDREVAVKILRADLLKEPDVVKRFVREARAGARLNHPNIATVHMVGQTEEGVPFLAMEFVEGVALSAVLAAGKPLPLRRLGHVGSQIASALGEAHGQGIVHRDLKPENILLTDRRGEADVVKVVDFGIAKMLAHAAPGEDPISRMGTVFGTPHYIAPEQAAGQPVDGRADIYSLGCILFQMATGRVPFDGQQGLQVLLRQVRDPVPDPRRLNAKVTPALAELILKMLAKDPASRPQTAALVAAALHELSADATAPASGRRSGPPRLEPAPEADWYRRDEAAEGADGVDKEDDEAPRRRRRRSAELAPAVRAERGVQGRTRRPVRSGRPSQESPAGDDEISDDELPRRGRKPSFWQRHWMPLVSIGSAVTLGALAGLLYAHYHGGQQSPLATTPAVVAAVPAAPPAPATSLIRSSSPSRLQVSRPASSPAAPPKIAEPSIPVTVFPAGPPLSGPRPLGPGPTGSAAGHGLAAGPAAASSAPAPTPLASATPPAAAPPAAAPSPPAAAPTPPAAAPSPPPTVAAPPPPAAASAPAAEALPPPAKEASAPPPAAVVPVPKTEEPSPPPPAKEAEDPDENGNDPYHRLK